MRSAQFFQRATRRAGQELANFALIGPGVLSYHVSRLSRRSECELELRAVGPITVRPADSDLATLRQVFYLEEYRVPVPEVERALARANNAILSSGRRPVIVDAGANIGAATLWMAGRYPEAHIVSVEPDPTAHALLQRNTRRISRVSVIEAAIGSEPGHVKLFTTGDSWSTQTERSESGTQIVTMEQAFRRVANGTPFIAKIDIEGFESDLFARNLAWLDEVTAVLLEPHDWRFPGEHTSRSFQRALGERDFELFIVAGNLVYVRL